jgi:hypothetical protein
MWLCDARAADVLFKTRRRLTFEVERPLIHPSIADPTNQSQVQRVDASQRNASTPAVRSSRTRSPSTSCVERSFCLKWRH